MSKSNVIMLTGNIVMSVFKMTYVTYSGTDIKQQTNKQHLLLTEGYPFQIYGL